MPVMAPRRIAASATVRAMGPRVSWVWEMGMTPERLSRPTVGLIPTMPQIEGGGTIEAAGGGGGDDRAVGLRAHGRGAEVCRHRRRRARAGARGVAVERVGVAALT